MQCVGYTLLDPKNYQKNNFYLFIAEKPLKTQKSIENSKAI